MYARSVRASTPKSVILIVRHGVGRGRLPAYLQPVLDHLRDGRPEQRAEVRLHETGAPEPSLDGVTAVVFWLADPLREHFPACFEEAAAIAAAARERGIPIVNPPEALSNTVKSVQSRLWLAAGIPTPAQDRFVDHAELSSLLDRTTYPAIVRPDDQHAQTGMRLCSSRTEVEAAVGPGFRFPGALTSVVDVRAGFRATAPGTVWARYHHKKRALVLGGRAVATEIMFARSAIVSSETCTFRRYAGRGSLPDWIAPRLRWERRCISEDVAFAQHGTVPADLLQRAVRALGLHFAAIDYADLPDGGAILWEANPHFRLPRVEEMYLRGPRRIRERHERLFRELGDFLTSLAHDGRTPSG